MRGAFPTCWAKLPAFLCVGPLEGADLGVDVCVDGVLLDEFAARAYVVAHEHREDVVGVGSVFKRHLLEEACFGTHGGFPELLGVHFAETFVALGGDAVFGAVAVFVHEGLTVAVGVAVFFHFAFL